MGFKDATDLKEGVESLAQSHDLGVKSGKLLVVYSKLYNQLLHDPMTGKPIVSRHRAFLEPIAKEFKGEILDIFTATNRILKKHRNGKPIDPQQPV